MDLKEFPLVVAAFRPPPQVPTWANAVMQAFVREDASLELHLPDGSGVRLAPVSDPADGLPTQWSQPPWNAVLRGGRMVGTRDLFVQREGDGRGNRLTCLVEPTWHQVPCVCPDAKNPGRGCLPG